MKAIKGTVFFILILALAAISCGQVVGSPSTDSPASAYNSSNLFVVVGQSSSKFAGNGNGDGLPLDQFRAQNNIDIYVEIVDDRKLDDYRNMMLSGQTGAPDVLICDDTHGCDALQGIKYIASHKVGVAIREDIANQLGLSGNIISYATFAELSEPGQLLKPVTSNALAGYAALENFLSTMAWCSQTDAANLTAEIVKRADVQACGKTIFDNIKSTNGGQEALNLVYNSATDPVGFNAVITYDSDLLGKKGLNTKLQNEGKPIFKFYYFIEATAQANVGIGTRKFDDGDPRAKSADKLVRFFYDGDQGDASQMFINLSGFTEGSAGLFNHYDDAFNANWSIVSNPIGVQIVNSPVPPVAAMGKEIYKDLYKRAMEIDIYVDISGSTVNDQEKQVDITLPADFKIEDANKYCGLNEDLAKQWKDAGWIDEGEEYTYTVTKLQAMACAIETFSNQAWAKENGVELGKNGVVRFWLFTDYVTTSPVATATGPEELEIAGKFIADLIGPAHGLQDLNRIQTDLSQYNAKAVVSGETVDTVFNPFNGTWIFDALKHGTNAMLPSYDPNKDYYSVMLTDGKNNDEATTNSDGYFQYWQSLNKKNISLMGIRFGELGTFDRNDMSPEYTQKFGGNSFVGTSDEDLIKAFKFILGN